MASKLEILIKTLFDGKGSKDARTDLDKTGRELEQLKDKGTSTQSRLATGWAKVAAGSTRVRQGVAASVSTFKTLKSVGGSALDHLSKGFRAAVGVVKTLTVSIAAVAAGFVKLAVDAAQYNVQMARAWTMTKQGIGWFGKMRKEVRALAGDLGLAKSELAGGLYQALSAGVPDDNVLSFLHTAAKIAVADGSEVAVAIDGLTTVMNAFKLEADQTDYVADQMFKTVANGKTDFAALAQNMATVAPIAAANEVAFEQVLAAVATLTKQGVPTAQAMTQIRAGIIGVTKVMGDGWSKTMSLQQAFGAVARQAGGSQNALRGLVGEIEAVQGILGLTGINANGAAADLRDTADAAGSLDVALKKVDQFRHWPKLWETVKGAVNRVGQVIDEQMKPSVEQITALIAGWRDSDSLFDSLGEKLGSAAEKINVSIAYLRSGGELSKVFEVAGLTIKGHVLNAAGAALEVLAKNLPGIVAAAVDAVKEVAFNGSTSAALAKTREEFFGTEEAEFSFGRLKAESSQEFGDRLKENKQSIRLERLDARGIEIAGNIDSSPGAVDLAAADALLESMSAITQTVDHAVEEAAQVNQRLEDIIAQGLTGRDLDAALAGLELTAEDMERLFEYTDSFQQSAANIVGEAAKAAQASVEMQGAVADHASVVARSTASIRSQMVAADSNLQLMLDVTNASAKNQQLLSTGLQSALSRIGSLESYIRNMYS